MKIRNGFVSNSSSSSFLVWFPEVPKDVQSLRKLLFGDAETWEAYDDPVPTEVLAAEIWSDMQDQLDAQPYSDEFIREELENNAYWVVSEARYKKRGGRHIRYDTPEYEQDQMELRVEVDKKLDQMVEECKQRKGTLFRFHYSDNEGHVETTLEHGEVFSKLSYIQISHH